MTKLGCHVSIAESSLGLTVPRLSHPQALVDFNRWARARARTASPSTGSLLHRAKYLNCLNPNAAPPALHPPHTPLPPAFFSQGPSHHRSPLTTIISSLSFVSTPSLPISVFSFTTSLSLLTTSKLPSFCFFCPHGRPSLLLGP